MMRAEQHVIKSQRHAVIPGVKLFAARHLRPREKSGGGRGDGGISGVSNRQLNRQRLKLRVRKDANFSKDKNLGQPVLSAFYKRRSSY